jgi:hypothetical protein
VRTLQVVSPVESCIRRLDRPGSRLPPAAHAASAPELSAKEVPVLETIIIILVILWALGMIGGYTMGGLIHILLIVALIVLILRLIRGRRVL